MKQPRVTVTAYPALSSLCVCVCMSGHLFARFVVRLHDYMCVFVCVCAPTSPGIVIVGHSVCGLDGGEVWLQGEQLTGQVWHTTGRRKERRAQLCFSFYFYVTRKVNLKNVIYCDRQAKNCC